MPIYVDGEYFSILTEIVREDLIVPFDCYLYLRANARAVCLVKKNEPFEKAKLDKLRAFKIQDLYVKNVDQPLYEEYLRSFFKTDEGAAVLKEAFVHSNGGPVNGLPDSIATEFAHLKPVGTELPAEPAADLPQPEIVSPVASEMPIVADAPVIPVAGAPEEVGNVTVTGSASPHEAIVRLLRENADELGDQLVAGAALTPEEREIIEAATASIEEELVKVAGQKGKNPDEAKVVVKGAAEKIKEHVERVAGLAAKEGRQYKVLQGQVEVLEKKSEDLARISSAPETPADFDVVVKKVTESISTESHSIKSLASVTSGGTVSGTVNKIIAGLEEVLGAKLEIKREGSENSVDVGTVSAVIKDKIEAQNQIIATLNTRLKSTQGELKSVMSKWEEFQAQTYRKFDDTDKMAAKSLGLQLGELQTSYLSTKGESDLILSSSSSLCKDVGIDPSLSKVTISGAGAASSFKTVVSSKQPSLDIPDEADDSAGAEELRGENVLLRAQLNDAKALIDNNSQNIAQLKTYVENSDAFTQDLERDRLSAKEELEKLRERVQQLESGNLSLEESANTAQKIASRSKSEIQSRDTQLHRLKEELQVVMEELKVFREKFAGINIAALSVHKDLDKLPVAAEVLALLKSKDQMISGLKRDIETQAAELKALEKLNAQEKNKAEESSNLKKRMAQRYERLEAEKENLRRDFESANRKVISSANLVDSERKTISKMTQMIEELKKDRVEFMNKTNLAMKAHKDVITKASSLNTRVQNELERNKAIQTQVAELKQKMIEMMSRFTEQDRAEKVLQNENAALKKQIMRERKTA